MKIVFIGTVQFSKDALVKLISLGADIAAVVTRKDAGGHADYAGLSLVCRKAGIEFQQTNDINSEGIKEYIKSKSPDYIFCFGWSQLLDNVLLSIPKKGVIGFHPALLPKNRGRHPIVWALAFGLKTTGSTFFFADEKADSGDILSQKKIRIEYRDDAATLYKKITKVALVQIEEFLPQLDGDKFKRVKQSRVGANIWRKRSEKDGVIDWRMPSFSIYNLVRALTKPYVGAHFFLKGKKIKVWKVQEIMLSGIFNLEPGKVIKVYNDGSFLVKTSTGCVRILEYSPSMILKEGDYL